MCKTQVAGSFFVVALSYILILISPYSITPPKIANWEEFTQFTLTINNLSYMVETVKVKCPRSKWNYEFPNTVDNV